MPLYFFDFHDAIDADGLSLADDGEAWAKAREAIPDVLREVVSSAMGDNRSGTVECYCQLRNEQGAVMGRLIASFHEMPAEHIPPSRRPHEQLKRGLATASACKKPRIARTRVA